VSGPDRIGVGVGSSPQGLSARGGSNTTGTYIVLVVRSSQLTSLNI